MELVSAVLEVAVVFACLLGLGTLAEREMRRRRRRQP